MKIRANNFAIVFVFVTLLFGHLPNASGTCRWDGTAPFCAGTCGTGETEKGRASTTPTVVENFPSKNSFGNGCVFGSKAYCCKTPGVSCRWDGTAPFCDGECEPDEEWQGACAGTDCSGMPCWTGTKVYCCKQDPGSSEYPLIPGTGAIWRYTDTVLGIANNKVFINTQDGRLFELFWKEKEWVWVNHKRPATTTITLSPGAAMQGKLFVVTENGHLFEHYWNEKENKWKWQDHGHPTGKKIATAPGAAMLNKKLFVGTDDGYLFERYWNEKDNKWEWSNHGRPDGKKVATTPGAAMLNKKLFVGTDDGYLFERHWNEKESKWKWSNHGRPEGKKIAIAPGAAMLNKKFFVGTDDGYLFERHWENEWKWRNHGRPEGKKVATAPGAAMLNKKFFVGTDDGYLFERHWENEWKWRNHGRPEGKKVATAPGAAMLNKKLFVGTDDGYLFERHWNEKEDKWKWVSHGLTRGDLSAYDWCYSQSDSDITFYPIVKNEGFIEWESMKVGYYNIGIEVEGSPPTKSKFFPVWPSWSLKKGETYRLHGFTLPFYKEGITYFFIDNIWALSHPDDANPGNNSYETDKKYLYGKAFLENGKMYGKRCRVP